jgi:DNA topoisomerase-1
MILIVVESPTKAKALTEYLKEEKKYQIVATYGHIKNLLPKSNSIDVEHDYAYKWITTPQWEKHRGNIIEKAKLANKIILATDLDREGEGISWHFMQELHDHKITAPIERIIFNSISKDAIKDALNRSQQIRYGLVEAYLARIGLDYLFGFSISPILWRKIPCCRSAGRVQSAALRLLVEREDEIKNFQSKSFQKIFAKFKESKAEALLIEYDDIKLENGQIFEKNISAKDLHGEFRIDSVKRQQQKLASPPPFITATLQQAASNLLNFSPKLTMQLAQKLYEGFKINEKHVGLITYMRTDSTAITTEFIHKIRTKIEQKYGEKYLPSKFNIHHTIDKTAQEAHEAIRVTDLTIENPNLGDEKLEKLYKIIWQRTMASQMTHAISENVNIKISGSARNAVFEMKSSSIIFDGYKKLYNEQEEEETHNKDLDHLIENQNLHCEDIFATEHETQPPKRYSEAMLIQLLKKNGIGRPSTYDRIIEVLYEREYAQKNRKIITPTQKGIIAVAFLIQYFPEEVAYEFTSNLEEELDKLHDAQKQQHKEVLAKFWTKIKSNIDKSSTQSPMEVANKIQQQFPKYFLQERQICEKCMGKLLLKITKIGAMLGCENYPTCNNTVNIEQQISAVTNVIQIGEYNCVTKTGPFGPYLEFVKDGQQKRVSIPKIWATQLDKLSFEQMKLLSELPKEIGEHDGEKMLLAIGKFGPYVKYNNQFISIKDPANVTVESVLMAINAKKNKSLTVKKRTSTKK